MPLLPPLFLLHLLLLIWTHFSLACDQVMDMRSASAVLLQLTRSAPPTSLFVPTPHFLLILHLPPSFPPPPSISSSASSLLLCFLLPLIPPSRRIRRTSSLRCTTDADQPSPE